METIVALSTPVGRSAIAVVRMSGDDSIEIAAKIFSPMPRQPNQLKVGKLLTQHFAEQAMCVFFVAPHSYTGENTVEFHCHGGIAVSNAVLSACLANGARMALNGEFSKRAFLNGKMNLSNAEGIIDMIDAETAAAAKAGSDLLENKLGRETIAVQDVLTDLIGRTEAALDYPEEDLDLPTAEKVAAELDVLSEKIEKLLNSVDTGKMVKYGVNVAIAGKPNVGKSSLLNAFLGSDRAIVSDVEGTTRDTLTESVFYKDTKFNFVDTAGLRETHDPVEKEGVRRARQATEKADVVLYVVDTETDESTFDGAEKVIKVYNKCDLYAENGHKKTDGVYVSAKNGTNIERLKEKIYDLFSLGQINATGTLLTNERHVDCLTRTAALLREAKEATGETMDVLALKLKEAWTVLGEITGTTATEEIIDRIYSKFCLGK